MRWGGVAATRASWPAGGVVVASGDWCGRFFVYLRQIGHLDKAHSAEGPESADRQASRWDEVNFFQSRTARAGAASQDYPQ